MKQVHQPHKHNRRSGIEKAELQAATSSSEGWNDRQKNRPTPSDIYYPWKEPPTNPLANRHTIKSYETKIQQTHQTANGKHSR